MRLFSYDGIPAQILRYLARLFLLTLCHTLCCLPVVTFGAASTAIYAAFFQNRWDEGLIRSYFSAFRDNFKQATTLWLIALLPLLLLAGDYYCLFAYDFVNEGIAWVVTVLISLVYLSMLSFLFPLQARYENPGRITIRNAMILGVGLLPLGVFMNAMNVLPALIYLISPELYSGVMVWWVPIWWGLAAQINSWILMRVFRRLQPESDGGRGEEAGGLADVDTHES